MTPAARRQAVAHACAVHEVSERRACAALGVDRSSVRYSSRRACDAAVRLCIRGLAAQRRRFGYRRLHLLLTREGHHMNHKRFRRLYREEKLQVRRRSGRKRALGVRALRPAPATAKTSAQDSTSDWRKVGAQVTYDRDENRRYAAVSGGSRRGFGAGPLAAPSTR